MRKNVWILNHYAMPPQYEVRPRNNKMAHFMQQEGYSVTIFAASTIHNTDINLIMGSERYIRRTYGDLSFVHIKAPAYRGNGLSRVINMMVFPLRLFLCLRNMELSKPDVIINDLGLKGFFFPFLLGKRYDCPVITEVRDLWPESVIDYGYLRRESVLARFLYWCERMVYKSSDAVVFSQEGGVQYIHERGWDNESGGPIDMARVHYINNGVDIAEFDENRDRYVLADPVLDDKSIFRVVYVGSIRHANEVSILLDAARILKQRGDEGIRFIIYGDGDDRPRLEQRVAEEGLDNVLIRGYVAKQYVPSILSRASLNVLHARQVEIFKRGSSSNKLFEYMASGKPILSTIQMDYSIIDRYGCGRTAVEHTPEAIADAIVQFCEMPEQALQRYGHNASVGARDFDWKTLTTRLVAVIENV